MLVENLDADKYTTEEYSVTPKRAGLMSLAVLVPYYVICVVIYLTQRNYANIFATIFKATFLLELFLLAIGIFVVICIALILKAAALSIFSGNKANNLKFKIIKEAQKPHCFLSEPIKIWEYRICLIIYIFFSALLPYIISLILGDFMFVLVSFIPAYWAGNDIWLLIKLFGKKGGDYVIDFDSVMLYRIYKRK